MMNKQFVNGANFVIFGVLCVFCRFVFPIIAYIYCVLTMCQEIMIYVFFP